MPYARVLLVSAVLMPSLLFGQVPANAPPDAVFHAVTYVETRAPAAKAARATLEQVPATRAGNRTASCGSSSSSKSAGQVISPSSRHGAIRRRLTRVMPRRRSSSWARSSRSA